MRAPSDYKELLKILNRRKVRYLVVGAYAVIYYTEPRYTKDLDIWIEPELTNAKKLYSALKEFGAPLKNIAIEDFTNKNLVYQIGVEPVRIDIIMEIANIDFTLAWRRREITAFDGVKVNIISLADLMKSKKTMARSMDRVDLENLSRSKKLKGK
ncbi:MAG: nucleotidyltransferase [Candidatus Omnitrophica bacterium]|nr:nucleotidyltransferase [Candidatus Omnitrophota bacterium]